MALPPLTVPFARRVIGAAFLVVWLVFYILERIEIIQHQPGLTFDTAKDWALLTVGLVLYPPDAFELWTKYRSRSKQEP